LLSQTVQLSAGQRNLGPQYKEDPSNRFDQLNAGQKEEYRRLLTRLRAELGIAAFP